MTQITVNEEFQPTKYLLISRIDEEQSVVTTRLIISDENQNTIKIVNIEQGPQGDRGPVGLTGPAGKDAPTFEILPIVSGGTNNSIYSSGNIIYYDGTKLSSTTYSIQDILNEANTGSNVVTGVIAGSGIQKTGDSTNITLDVLLGDGLNIGLNNEIVVDNTIARVSELNLGQINGILPIGKGGTNNDFFTQNRFIYFDGTKIRSFPIATGNFLFSGISVNIVAGSGLVGGGNLQIPNGTVAINIPSSADIIVEDDLIRLSNTGTPGTYSKIITDERGRVVSGTTLTLNDIIEILGYTPYHPGNDGTESGLDADLLDGQHGNYYRNAINLTGIINPNVLPSAVIPGNYTKIGVASNGLVSGVFYADESDIIASLGYRPVPISGSKTITGDTTLEGNINLNGELTIYDHLPLLATDNRDILPDTPRGISFIYGGLFSNKTGLLAYYPASDELKLVTNIFASGADTDIGGNQDDLNGGDAESIYVIQNLDGDSSTILLRHIADTLYVKTVGDESIRGQKVFVDNIVFQKQIRINDPVGNTTPPFDISSNTNKVINLNSDLLDNEHGSYYRNAANITGAFNYTNVTFDHIQGTQNYIPKFNDPVNDPAGRIDDSIIYQDSNDNIIIDNDQNIILGQGNVINASASITIGQNHTINGDNNLVAGQSNAITGNNSIALNSNSKVNANNSIALGNFGYAYLPNQISIGAFNTNDQATNQRLEHGQHSTITMHMVGNRPGNTWNTLTPTITIPSNKTFAYNLDLLITKAFGTGVAQYKFESGIFKNATFRDSNNITSVINVTTQPQTPKKLEIFNNSQIKNHYHTFEHTNGQRQLQDVKVTEPLLNYSNLTTENINDYYFYTKLNKSTSGTYYKTNDGNLVLDIDKPVFSGSFTMDTTSRGIKIISKDHGVRAGSEVFISFIHESGQRIPDTAYKVYSVINKDIFFIERPAYSGYVSYYSGILVDYAMISLNQNSIAEIDKLFMSSSITGNINSNGYIDNLSSNYAINIFSNLKVNAPLIIRSGDLYFNRLVDSFNTNSILLNSPISTGTGAPQQPIQVITGPVQIYQIDFSFDLFKRSPKLYIKTIQDGEQFLNTSFTGIFSSFQGSIPFVSGISDLPTNISFYTTGNYLLKSELQNVNTVINDDYSHLSSILIKDLSIPKRSTYPSGRLVEVLPLIENSGSVLFHHKQSVDGNFSINNTVFNKYQCIYTKYNNNNKNQLFIYHTGLDRSITLDYTPLEYSLCPGFLDNDNNQFNIISHNDKFFLQNKYHINYEQKNIYNIRVKVVDRSKQSFLEKAFTLTVNDSNEPYSSGSIPHLYTDISELFTYTIPSFVFVEEENAGPLLHSAKLQNNRELPSWLSFDANTITFSGQPDGCDLGTYNIRVTATNNFSSIYQDFYLTVRDSIYQTSNYFKGNDTNITDIILQTTTVNENTRSGTIISDLDATGSFKPYLRFNTAQNSFIGLFKTNSDIVECQPDIITYPTITLSGVVDFLALNSIIDTNDTLNLPINNRAINIYKPFAISGTPGLVDGRIYLTDSYNDYGHSLFSGLKIQASGNSSLPREFIIQNFDDYSIFTSGRISLAIETDSMFRDTLMTEEKEDIVISHSPIMPLWMSTEQQITEPTGVVTELEQDKLIIADGLLENVLWASGYPGCNDRDLIGNTLVSFTPRARSYNIQINTTGTLENFNPSPQSGLKRSNIKYGQDLWSFRNDIYNPVLSLYGVGSGEFCRIKTETDDLLDSEDNNNIISTQQNHHGTRIVINRSYEILEAYEAVKDNGRLMSATFDALIAENNEPLVHDYAIAARSGDVCLLFPGKRQGDFIFTYTDEPDQVDDTYNYYYNWGSLIPFDFINKKSFMRMSNTYVGTNTTSKVRYTEILPETNNYPISGIKTYTDTIYNNCSSIVFTGNKGFESHYFASGSYTTGLVEVYTEAGTGVVILDFYRDINLDTRDNHSIYLDNFVSSNTNLQLPVVGTYKNIKIIDANTIEIYNRFLMPNSGIQSQSSSNTGVFRANIDQNHGFIEEPYTVINRVPVLFTNAIKTLNGIDNNIANRPKDYTFDIININGNKISVKDDKNYLLKENNRPDYYDQPIKGSYLTNGIAFSGSFFSGITNIYDIRYDLQSINSIFTNINFQYDHTSKIFRFDVPSGIIKPYDHIKISFPTGILYSSNDIYALINKNSIIDPSNVDNEPDKDMLLLESSKINNSTETLQHIKITGLMTAGFSTQGTCTIDINLINRLESGLKLNHTNSTLHNGYEIQSISSGFNFTGVIPKNNNIISTNITGLITNQHIGYASIFGTGFPILYTGTRILRTAQSDEIGYAEYYLINNNSTIKTIIPPQYPWQSPFEQIVALTPSNISGIGTNYRPYTHKLESIGVTDDNTKYLEFVYLGHNTNTIQITGIYGLLGGSNRFSVYHTTFNQQIDNYRNLLNRQIPTVEPRVFSTGIDSLVSPLSGTIDLSIIVNRFDKIKIELKASSGYSYTNSVDFGTYVINDVSIKPYILETPTTINSVTDYYPYIKSTDVDLVYVPVPTFDSNQCIDCETRLSQFVPQENPNYSPLNDHEFTILPFITTNIGHCGNNIKNKQLFFNGNLIEIFNFNTIKSFLIENDEFTITSFNNISSFDSGVSKHLSKFNATSEYGIISGICIEGARQIPPKNNQHSYSVLKENEYRYNLPIGLAYNALLPNTGLVQFIRSVSGDINVLDYNNIFYHTYGGTTAYYPQDHLGKLVPPPQTGIYSVVQNQTTCSSGTLCVIISGYNQASFTGVYPTKTMFFDFDDGIPAISNTYNINDLLQPNVLSVSIPYNSGYIGKSGIAYIIDSVQNIKSNLNPNLNNGFVISYGSVNGIPSASPKVFDYYDHSTKRWKHTIHLAGPQPAYTGYNIALSSTNSKFYSINPNQIRISGIQYSFGNLNNFNTLNNSLTISDNISEVIFRITTLDGDQSLFNNQRFSIPKVSMSGLGIYQLDFSEPAYFGWHGSGWNIGVRWKPPAEDYNNKQIIVRVSDTTGDSDQIVSISKRKIPAITPFYPTGFVASGNMWQVGFDISKINIENKLFNEEIFAELANMPDSNNYDIAFANNRCIIYSGDTRGFATGIYNLQLVLTDISSTPYTILGTGYSPLSVLSHLSQKPAFSIVANNLPSTYYLNIDNYESIKFDIPADLGPTPNEVFDNFNLTFNNSPTYNLVLTSSSYNHNTKRFEIIATPQTTGDNPVYVTGTARHINQSVGVILKQPVYDNFGGYTYQTYTRNIGFNVVFYKPIVFEGISQQNLLSFDINEPWSIEFYAKYGITEHDAFNYPNAKIFKAPNLGQYESEIAQYVLNYEYDNIFKKWKVTAVGQPDSFGRFIDQTGIYPISIYLEDEYSSNITNDDYSISYGPITRMKNISPIVYSTPNNEFFTKVDSLDLNEQSANQISFPGNLKENSIILSPAKLVRKYDRDFNIWQNGYASEKILDKYDARINIAGDTISVQCKGIGQDKIMAVAKLNAIEIESNELQGIPLTITGIVGYTPGGAINVQQGGDGWQLRFKTIGGLAHASYPPTIILDNMPTFCTGFNPLIETQLQCLVSPPSWNPNDQGGSWNYHFSGVPSCILLGRKNFTITAIDTDTSLLPDSPYLPDTDQVPFAFEYQPGQFEGSPPKIEINPQYVGMDIIKPLCNTYYTKQLDFGPGNAALCIGPTGIKSFAVSGSVPSGLSYSVYFPEDGDQPVSPYSNLGSGYLRVEGYPLTFANGGSYPEQLILVVTDARDKVISQTITFTDSSVANEPDVGITVYFDSPKPALSPVSGLGLIQGDSTIGWRPPAIEDTLECQSVLPHNKCKVSEIIFSGTAVPNNLDIYLINLSSTPVEKRIQFNDTIYIAFDSYNDGNDGTYTIKSDNLGLYITGQESLQNPSQIAPITGIAKTVKSIYTNININNFDGLFNGNVKDNTTYCILGGGRAKYPPPIPGQPQRRGLLGLLVPSFKTQLTGIEPFRTSDSKLEKLSFTRVNNNVDIRSKISWSDCWQTGNLFISGIVLPPIYAEITDPPPVQGYFFTYNGLRQGLSTRLAFGDSEVQRNLPENLRYATLAYTIEDMLSGVILRQGSVAANSVFDSQILTRESGTVYRLTISKGRDTFPTYNYNSLPASTNEYIWIHKGDNLVTVPTQNTFPPVMTFGFDSISVINSLTDEDPNGVVMDPIYGLAIGGYVPTDDGIGPSVPYSHSGNISVSGAWSAEDFLPTISGIIQAPIFVDFKNTLSSSYSYNQNIGSGTITISNISPNTGDIIKVEFYEQPQFGSPVLRYTGIIDVVSNNITNSNLIINTNLGPWPFNGFSKVDFGTLIYDIDLSNNELVLKNNFTYNISDNICVDKNSFVSTELGLLNNNGYISVVSGDNSFVYLGNSNSSTGWLYGFNSNDFVKVYQNIDDNIKIMPYNIVFNTEGNYIFQITGRSNTRENEDLLFKIMTMDNPNMPVFDKISYPWVNLSPKKHFQNYTLHVNKPISIIESSVNKTGNNLTFSISGGKRPIYANSPDVQIAAGLEGDFGYCGFWRQTIVENEIKDEYDAINDRLNIKVILSSDYGINWSLYNTIKIKVSDETGTDTYTYTVS